MQFNNTIRKCSIKINFKIYQQQITKVIIDIFDIIQQCYLEVKTLEHTE